MTEGLLPWADESAARLFEEESRFPDSFKLESFLASRVGDVAIAFLLPDPCSFFAAPAVSGLLYPAASFLFRSLLFLELSIACSVVPFAPAAAAPFAGFLGGFFAFPSAFSPL